MELTSSLEPVLWTDERRFREMIDALPAAVYTTDAEGRITHFNPAAAKLSGRHPQLGSDNWCVSWKLYRPDGTPLPHDKCPMAIALKEGRAVRGEEIVAERPDGQRIWVEAYPTPLFDDAGNVIGGINMLVDITERKQKEHANALLGAIVDSSDDAIISKDLNGVITSWNLGAERLFRYTAGEAIGQYITMLIPSDRLHEESQILDRLKHGERIDHFETVRVRKDGTPIDISVTISPVKDAKGRVIGASKIARDITLRKQLEETLKQMDRRKTEFLAILAHELRNPLAPIRHALQILQRTDGSNGELAKSTVDMMQRQVGQMVRLVDDLLDVSRISRGKIELRNEKTELASVVHHAVEAARPLCQSMDHELTVTLPPQPIYLHGDPVRLAQIVGNLLNNACKFTERGGHIQLTVERDQDQAVIRVQDNGVGIPPEKLDSVFEMFQQVDTSLERSQSGLGIGLTLVKNLAEMHGGTVEARSAGVGHGSEFVVRLPILSGPLPAPRPLATARQAATTIRRRILVVDDNRDSADSLARLLKLSGHEVHASYDGLAAVEAARQFQPDLLLLDIGLPGLNGYEAAHRIREDLKDRRVTLVALTGWGLEEDRQKSKAAGFSAHLVKPIDYNALTSLLASLASNPAGSSSVPTNGDETTDQRG